MKQRSPVRRLLSRLAMPASTQGTILYVEDNPANTAAASLNLSPKYTLLIAKDAQAACRYLRLHSTQIHAVLMDIELQGSDLDGIELTRLMRGTLEQDRIPSYARDLPVLNVPVIFLTAFGDRYPDSLLADAGGNRCMIKPANFDRLMTELANLTGETPNRAFTRISAA